jgi:peptidyl-prolyl cis-trans isomerase SurA
MRRAITVAFASAISFAAIIDRVAIVVDKHPILDSAIDRDIRITSFLNRAAADLSLTSRKQAASRLIDQELIRTEIRTGDYPVAPEPEAAELLAQIKKDRPDYRQALSRTAITEGELKDRLLWQMTVLRFIDARFRPGVNVTSEEIAQYFNAHRAQFPGTLEEAGAKVSDFLTGEQVNQALDEWLEQKRQQTRIEYLEKTLQ